MLQAVRADAITPDGVVENIWDVSVSEPAYQAVADTLAALVKGWVIDNVFLHTEKVVGTAKTFQQLLSPTGENGVITWRHHLASSPGVTTTSTCPSRAWRRRTHPDGPKLEPQTDGLIGVGNKHWFFMLAGCVNADGARPFYNEFLKAKLEPHRRTMEMVGCKLRTEDSDRQLSGLGFSSTKRDSLTVRVKGSFNRVVKVLF